MEQIIVFVLGLIFGSFANVMVLRLNTGESLIFGGSRCFFCGRTLRWFELVPILSFLALGGRCRTCGSKISLQYPLVELASGLLFFLLYFGPNGVWSIVFFWLLLVISVYDIRHKIIPNSLVYPATAAALLFLIIGNPDLIKNLAAGFGLFVFFGALWLMSRGRWMGFGDAKLAFALGLFLGWPEAFLALLLSFWFGAFFGVGLAVFNGIKRSNGWRGIQIPFAPFLSAGGLVAYLWGQEIIFWYLSLV